jgi:hypothetical protein
MASHLAVNIRFATDRFPHALAGALVAHDYFRLVSLAGIEGHERGDHWLLSGYALEDFLQRYLPWAPAKPASLQTVVASDGANRKYLEEVANRLESRRTDVLLSPFEVPVAETYATFVPGRRMEEAEVAKCLAWVERNADAALYFYGAVTLSPTPTMRAIAPWDCAFREMAKLDQIGAPFLLIRASRAPLAKGNLDITIRTESTLWLEGQENLIRLASIAESVLRSFGNAVIDASIDLDGSSFRRQEENIRAAFAGAIGG